MPAATATSRAGSLDIVVIGSINHDLTPHDLSSSCATDQARLIPAPDVSPVDPTGAGDAFCEAVAHGFSARMALADAVGMAVVAGALATTRPGAQAAMPTAEEVRAHLAQ